MAGVKSHRDSVDSARDLTYSVEEMGQGHLGPFEQAVLAAVVALRDQAYGVSIHAKVQQLMHPNTVALGAVYVTLDRLEEKGWVSSRLADPTPQRGGRAKRFFRLEPAGLRALERSVVAAKRVWDMVNEALGDVFGGQPGERRRVRAKALP